VNKFIILIITLFSIVSCQKQNSNTYINTENKAINDIILEMTKFDEMKNVIDSKNKKLILYIDTVLDTTIAYTYKPEGFEVSENELSIEEIEEAKLIFIQDSVKYEKEKNLFVDLKNNQLKKRALNYSFKNDQLEIKYFDGEKTEDFETNENEFGYLFISRIIFNEDYTKGYLHYDFICGDGCAWDYNIEIVKTNDKWKITEYFSGG
jgi:fructose-specific phosphotransferase system component IIB